MRLCDDLSSASILSLISLSKSSTTACSSLKATSSWYRWLYPTPNFLASSTWSRTSLRNSVHFCASSKSRSMSLASSPFPSRTSRRYKILLVSYHTNQRSKRFDRTHTLGEMFLCVVTQFQPLFFQTLY